MDATVFTAFLAAAIPGFFTPGPNNLMLMASSAKFGFRRTIPHGAGVAIGFAVMVFIVGLGLGEVFHLFPWLETVLKILAAINLLYLAWTLLGLKIKDQKAGDRPLTFLQGAGFQWINPKAWALAVSFVAMVVDFGTGPICGHRHRGACVPGNRGAVGANLDGVRRPAGKVPETHGNRAFPRGRDGDTGRRLGGPILYLSGSG